MKNMPLLRAEKGDEMTWKVFEGKVQGLNVAGDPAMPATKWWNKWFLLLFVWKKQSVLRVRVNQAYRLGFIPRKGKPRILTNKLAYSELKVRNGREDCIFFAVGVDGKEVPLELVEQTSKDDPKYSHVPLL